MGLWHHAPLRWLRTPSARLRLLFFGQTFHSPAYLHQSDRIQQRDSGLFQHLLRVVTTSVKFTKAAKSSIQPIAKNSLCASTAVGNPESAEIEYFPIRVRGRIPSLDGLRAVAILLVIQSHLAGGRYSLLNLGTGHFPFRFAYGNLGVRIFFVISGFLITTLLLQEQNRQGRISIKQFYIRRALRILPASYVFMLVLCIVAGLGIVVIPKESFLASFLYVRNYFGGGDWYTAHLWSLSVEEQFYLIWPAAMVLLGRRGAVVVGLCTLPIADFMRFIRPPDVFETNMDVLACGCILACLWGWLGKNETYQRFLRSRLFWILPGSILASVALVRYEGAFTAFGIGVSNVLIAVSLERFVRYHHLSGASFLNSRLAVTLGTLSYSLYLWQQLWIVQGRGQGLLQSFPFNVTMAMGCAILSYFLVEKPILRLRDSHRIAHQKEIANWTIPEPMP